MERALGSRRGGIAGLLTLPKEQWQAIEADLLACGFVRSQIGTPALPWSAVVAMVKYCEHGSAVYRVTHGEKARWSDAEHLLAWIVDLLNILVWFKTKDGSKGRNQPKPIARPGVTANERLTARDTDARGGLRKQGSFTAGTAMTIDELNALLSAVQAPVELESE